jgi:hypothetical protein
MFVSVKFSAYDTRTYTYTCDIDVKEGDFVFVATKDGQKQVEVVGINMPEPPFSCKPIIGVVEKEE